MRRRSKLATATALLLSEPSEHSAQAFAPQSAVARSHKRQRPCCMAAQQAQQAGTPLPKRALGSSDLQVSSLGLGCMSFGLKVDTALGHQLLDIAVHQYGVNLIDTSETYPKPLDSLSDYGRTDEIIASWLKGRDRASVVLATQIAGRSNYIDWMRKDGSTTALTPQQIKESVDASLLRLGTDYIDLLQIEWPDRYVGYLGDDCYLYENENPSAMDFETQLMALQELVDAGKVRQIGVGNETPYGIMQFCEHAEWDELPKIISCQASYNLLERSKVELGLIETCAPSHCNVGLIANTPLAGGALTGKYIKQVLLTMDKEARLNKYPGFQGRFLNADCVKATMRYKEVADTHGLTLGQMALTWVAQQPHIASTLVGATTVAQLHENLSAGLQPKLSAAVLQDIQKVYADFREPTLGPVLA